MQKSSFLLTARAAVDRPVHEEQIELGYVARRLLRRQLVVVSDDHPGLVDRFFAVASTQSLRELPPGNQVVMGAVCAQQRFTHR